MTEKYKIYLSEETKNRLVNDAELFEFTRSDGSVNLNGFLKELIVNYFEQYRQDNEDLMNEVISELTTVKSLKSKDASVLAERIIRNYINNHETMPGRSTVITLTVSGESYNKIKIIENNLLKDNSLSGYIKDMFLSYLSIPRNKREMIIFKQTFDTVSQAIAERRRLSFTNAEGNFKIVTEPYLIATSKEEQFSYVLCHDSRTKKDHTYRLSRLKNLFITSTGFERDEDVEADLTRKGIQRPHSMANDIHAVIRMTAQGKQMYKMIIKNRPPISSVDGDLYHFDWPELQLRDYFKRLGKEAVVVSPKSLKTLLRNYYYESYKAYEDPK